MSDSSSNNPEADVRKCTACQRVLQTDEPGDICSACLMQIGFESQSGHAEEQVDSDASQPTTAGEELEEESLADVQHLFPALEIIERIGQGGMGVVYKANQKHLGRLVALKILRSKCSQDPSLAERFIREARALAKLTHPNIVGVHDFGQAGDRPYLIMEYVDGTNLRQMLAQKAVTPEAALAMVAPICEALQFAHEEGIVHRDIKPENILIDRRGRVRIADFGLARLMVRGENEWTLTGTRQVMGTPHYMAPEQIQHPLEVDHRADIYSLGVVIYEMLTGELPIGRFELPSHKLNIDVRLDQIVLRTLEKEPSRRYQHVSEVQSDVMQVSTHDSSTFEKRAVTFAQPAIYIPAVGFLLASLIDVTVGLTSLFEQFFIRSRDENFLFAAAHLLAAFPLAFGGWQLLTRCSREWMLWTGIFGILPLHLGAWLSLPCSLWLLFYLYRGGPLNLLPSQSSVASMQFSGRLSAATNRAQRLGRVIWMKVGNVVNQIMIRVSLIPWLKMLRGLFACAIWFLICGVCAAAILYYYGFERFPATVDVHDKSAETVRILSENDLFIQIHANGSSENNLGLSQPFALPLRDTLKLSLFRNLEKSVRTDAETGIAVNGARVRPLWSRTVYSSHGFLVKLTAADGMQYALTKVSSGATVEPEFLLIDNLEDLNMRGLSSVGPRPVSFSEKSDFEFWPPLDNWTQISDWLARTGLPRETSDDLAASLFETLKRLQDGTAEVASGDGQPRLIPVAALMDLEKFQPMGDGRLSVEVTLEQNAVWTWSIAFAAIVLMGWIAIVLRIHRTANTGG